MEKYALITQSSNISCPNFTLVKTYNNDELLTDYNDGFENIFRQMCLDIPRQDIYIDEAKVNNVSDILFYISTQPYLKCDHLLVYLFLSQTMLSIPVLLIAEIISNINKDLVISSHEDNRTSIIINSDKILIEKKLSGVIPMYSGNIENKLIFDVSIDVDLVIGETMLYIRGYGRQIQNKLEI